jgi:hypothetical protein
LAPTILFALVLAAKSTSRRMVIASLALATLIAALIAAPYVTQIRQFPALAMEQNITLTTGSLKSLVDTVFAAPVLLFPQLKPVFSDLSSAFSIALWLSFAALLVLQLVRFSRADNALVERFIAAVVLTQFVLVALVSSKSYPWYMNMFLPAALLLPRPNWLSPLIIVVSCTELLGFTFVGRAHILDYLGTIALPTIYTAALNWPSVRAALAGEWRIEAHESLEQAPIAAAI